MIDNRGFEIWRSRDGENWLPVTKRGFNNQHRSP
jgi:hypothetical protein